MIDLTSVQRPRITGRYHASELWAITHNYLKPEDFFKPVRETPEMLRGTAMHLLCQERLKHLGYEIEPKREIQRGEITIVGKADAIKDHEGLEIKTSSTRAIFAKAKPWALYQAKMMCSLFEIPSFFVVQPVFLKDGRFILKAIGKEERDDEWFAREIKKVIAFHEKVVRINANVPA